MSTEARPFLVLGFASVHDSMSAQDALTAAGVACIAIPSPRELGELCGVALRLEPADENAAGQALERAGIPPRASAQILDR